MTLERGLCVVTPLVGLCAACVPSSPCVLRALRVYVSTPLLRRVNRGRL